MDTTSFLLFKGVFESAHGFPKRFTDLKKAVGVLNEKGLLYFKSSSSEFLWSTYGGACFFKNRSKIKNFSRKHSENGPKKKKKKKKRKSNESQVQNKENQGFLASKCGRQIKTPNL